MKDSVMSSPITASGTSPALAKQLQRDDTASLPANLTERFEIVKFLGTSRSSFYFVARDLAGRKTLSETGRIVRLKVLSDDAAVDEAQKELFYLEAAAAAKLSHQNITRTTEAEELGGIHFCTIEQSANAESLRGLLHIRSWLEISVAVSIALQVADALDHAHEKGVLHLNLNPENILIEADGRVLVTDFGIGSQQDLAWAHSARSNSHCLRYSSPEQIQGSSADNRSDLYSFGIILFEMLTDRVPFDSTDESLIKRKHLTQAPHSPQLFRQGISNYLSALVITLLEKNPAARFKTATQLQMALSKVDRTDFAVEAEPALNLYNRDEASFDAEFQPAEETNYKNEAQSFIGVFEAHPQPAHEDQKAFGEHRDHNDESIYAVDLQLEQAERGQTEQVSSESVENQSAEPIFTRPQTHSDAPDIAVDNSSSPQDYDAETAENFNARREFFEPPTITKIDPPPPRLSKRATRIEPSAALSTARENIRPFPPYASPDRSQRRRPVLVYLWVMIVILSLVYLLGRKYFPGHFLTADAGQQNNLHYELATPPITNPSSADLSASAEQTGLADAENQSNNSNLRATAGSIRAPEPVTPPRRKYARRSPSIKVRPPVQRKLQTKRKVRRPRYLKRVRERLRFFTKLNEKSGR